MTLCHLNTPTNDAFPRTNDASSTSLTSPKTEHGHPSGTRVISTESHDASSVVRFICAHPRNARTEQAAGHASWTVAK